MHEQSHATKGQVTSAVALACAVIAGLVLRAMGMNDGLWYDEIFRTRVFLGEGKAGLGQYDSAWQFILGDVHNPLYNLFMFFWIRVFGDGEFSIRVPTLLAGLLLVLSVYRWVRMRCGVVAARWATAWLWIAPPSVWFSTDAKNNMVTTCLAFGAFAMTDCALSRDSLKWASVRAIAASGLALWADFQSLFVLVPLWGAAITLRWERGSRAQRGRAIGIMIGALAIIAPLALHKMQHLSALKRGHLHYFHWHDAPRFFFSWLTTGDAIIFSPAWGWAIVAGVVLLLVARVLARSWKALKESARGRVVLAVCLIGPMVMLIVNEALVRSRAHTYIYQERNLLVIMPFFAVVLGVGLSRVGALRQLIIGGLLVAIGIFGTARLRTGADELVRWTIPKADMRGLVRVINEHPDAVVVSGSYLMSLDYYAPSATRVVLDTPESRTAATVLEHAREQPAIYVRLERQFALSPEEAEKLGVVPVKLKGMDVYVVPRGGVSLTPASR